VYWLFCNKAIKKPKLLTKLLKDSTTINFAQGNYTKPKAQNINCKIDRISLLPLNKGNIAFYS
jgi:hypothetical protein